MPKALLIFCLCLCLATPAWAFQARTKSVHDGDSINITNSDGVVVNIRLYGVDAPELKQSFGYQAKKRLIKLASRQTVDIEPMDTDRYGRTVALVRLKDGTLVNEVMVAEGLAWVYDAYCHREELCRNLHSLQDRARQERRGLWAESDPTPPSQWRREHKAEEWYKAPVRVMKRLVHKVKVVLHP